MAEPSGRRAYRCAGARRAVSGCQCGPCWSSPMSSCSASSMEFSGQWCRFRRPGKLKPDGEGATTNLPWATRNRMLSGQPIDCQLRFLVRYREAREIGNVATRGGLGRGLQQGGNSPLARFERAARWPAFHAADVRVLRSQVSCVQERPQDVRYGQRYRWTQSSPTGCTSRTCDAMARRTEAARQHA